MFHNVEAILPGVYRIWDVSRTAMYLVVGENEALLIDTGVGVGSLKEIIRRITDKPVTVIITHGHVDHAMGADEFEKVYMSLDDISLYGIHSRMEVRKGYVEGAAMTGADAAAISMVKDSDYLPSAKAEKFIALQPGSVFDLGGITAEVIAVPGHTRGSVAILFKELRLLMLGDACNAFTYLFDTDCPTVREYKNTLLALKEYTDGKYDRVVFSHGMGEGASDMIDRVIAVCDDIINGNVDNQPFRGFNGEPVCIAKAMDFQRFCRADGGEGNIVYLPDKI